MRACMSECACVCNFFLYIWHVYITLYEYLYCLEMQVHIIIQVISWKNGLYDMHTSQYLCIYQYLYRYIFLLYIYIYIYICVCVCVCVCMCVCVYIYIYTYIYTDAYYVDDKALVANTPAHA